MKAAIVFLGLCSSIWCPGLVDAQSWQPAAFNSGPISLFTTGGVTYAEYSWTIGGCLSLEGIGPLVRIGSNFLFDFRLELETDTVCPYDVIVESCGVVLGELAPGAYTLTTTSWSAPVVTDTFTVPTNATPTLQPIGFAPDGSFLVQVNGAANVDYVLQGSTDFKNWTSISTNSVGLGAQPGSIPGPRTVLLEDASPVSSGLRLYRVQILPTMRVGPG